MFGPNHPKVATSLNELAELYLVQDEATQAEPLLKRALTISEGSLGKDHLVTAIVLENYSKVLRSLNRETEAIALEKQRETPH